MLYIPTWMHVAMGSRERRIAEAADAACSQVLPRYLGGPEDGEPEERLPSGQLYVHSAACMEYFVIDGPCRKIIG